MRVKKSSLEKEFSKKLLHWFDQHGRHDLPWQHPKTAYRVWLSEIMLQQTQVKTVIVYFTRFIKRFPTLKSLALADIDDVLRLWAGLGYYARARNLHRTAQIIYQEHHGRFPNTIASLQQLPGIGRSTAGAIVAIAFGEQAAILDGNVKRVLTRLYALEGDVTDKIINDRLWQLAEILTPQKRSADYTQAIMDLGATICTRQSPACLHCPVNSLCHAYQLNQVTAFPTPKKKKQKPTKEMHLLLLQNNKQQILLQRRENAGIWGGLWCLPEVAANALVHEHTLLSPIKHTLTHFILQIHVHSLKKLPSQTAKAYATMGVWCRWEELPQLGFPAPIQKLLERVYDEEINTLC
jgi:A/G-specific adenine glycosylase